MIQHFNRTAFSAQPSAWTDSSLFFLKRAHARSHRSCTLSSALRMFVCFCETVILVYRVHLHKHASVSPARGIEYRQNVQDTERPGANGRVEAKRELNQLNGPFYAVCKSSYPSALMSFYRYDDDYESTTTGRRPMYSTFPDVEIEQSTFYRV